MSHSPRRGDAVEHWIKAKRDALDQQMPELHLRWVALDDLLDDYRLAADTGMTWIEPLDHDADSGHEAFPVKVIPPEGEPRSILSITMPRVLLRQISEIARPNGKSPAEWCRDLIESQVPVAKGTSPAEGVKDDPNPPFDSRTF